MRRPMIFYEYSGFVLESGEETDNLDQFPGNKNDLELLQKINTSLVPGKEVFDFGNNTIRSNSIVGVISVGQTQIEILPKLIRAKNSNGDSSILKNLMFMLSYTYSLDVEDAGISNLSSNQDSFIDAYIGIFATRLQKHLLRVGVPKSYIGKSENLNTIKGKIGFKENLSINSQNQARIFCHYDEFSENNPTSQTLKFVASSLRKLTKLNAV